MRRVAKPPCPAVLDPSGSPGTEERDDAIAHFTSEDWQKREADKARRFKFEVFSDPTVRAALNGAFGGLCAYCESPLEATAPTDVEHYRPKGPVRTEKERLPHGYYWLAATWENLLPSCIRCNRAEGFDYEDGSRRTSGKGSWFPLENEAARMRRHDVVDAERPLLLNPYRDDPAEHLAFDEEGRVVPRSRFGEETIRVLGLNRPGLVEARQKHLRRVDAHRSRLKRYERMSQADPEDEDVLALLEEARAETEELLRPGAAYSALAAQRLGIRA